MSLNQFQKRRLRQIAHDLRPVVQTGGRGLTDSVLKEIDRALHDHELIKVRLVADDREQRRAMIEKVCEHSGANLVQRIGHIAVFYRPNPDQPRISTQLEPSG